jgi:hypothetical protein
MQEESKSTTETTPPSSPLPPPVVEEEEQDTNGNDININKTDANDKDNDMSMDQLDQELEKVRFAGEIEAILNKNGWISIENEGRNWHLIFLSFLPFFLSPLVSFFLYTSHTFSLLSTLSSNIIIRNDKSSIPYLALADPKMPGLDWPVA